jgi:hypothetical protein
MMLYSTQLEWAWGESYFWTGSCSRGQSNCQSYSRKPKGSKIAPRELCKQEATTIRVRSWGSCVSQGFTHEGHENIQNERKLAPRYIGLFPILEKCGNIAYKLELPPSLAGVHDIFHVSQQKKCIKAPVEVVLPKVAPLEADLMYPEHSVKILDQNDRVTRCKTIMFFKVRWSNHNDEVATWESEDFLWLRHLDFALP